MKNPLRKKDPLEEFRNTLNEDFQLDQEGRSLIDSAMHLLNGLGRLYAERDRLLSELAENARGPDTKRMLSDPNIKIPDKERILTKGIDPQILKIERELKSTLKRIMREEVQQLHDKEKRHELRQQIDRIQHAGR